LLDEHILFDVLPDDVAGKETLSRYKFVKATNNGAEIRDLDRSKLSRFDLPSTVRVSANRSDRNNELTLHFVNYNREEPPRGADGRPSAGGGIKDEKPIAVKGGSVEFVLPDGVRVQKVNIVTPEDPDPKPQPFTQTGQRLRFKMPSFLVYAVARINFANE